MPQRGASMPGEHADGAARLEGGAIPLRREHRQADRVLTPLVPAVLEPPRVGRGLVHAVEVSHAEGLGRWSSQQHLSDPGEMGHDPGGEHRSGVRRGRSSSWLAEHADRRRACVPAGPGGQSPGRPVPGHARIAGLWPSATSRSDRSAPRPGARRPLAAPHGLRALVGMGVRPPGRQAPPNPAHCSRSTADSLLLQAARPVSGIRSLNHPMSAAPSRSSAAAGSSATWFRATVPDPRRGHGTGAGV